MTGPRPHDKTPRATRQAPCWRHRPAGQTAASCCEWTTRLTIAGRLIRCSLVRVASDRSEARPPFPIRSFANLYVASRLPTAAGACPLAGQARPSEAGLRGPHRTGTILESPAALKGSPATSACRCPRRLLESGTHGMRNRRNRQQKGLISCLHGELSVKIVLRGVCSRVSDIAWASSR